MNPEIKIARNVSGELSELIAGTPAFETEHGLLFISETVPVACIKLKISREEYLQFLRNLPGSELPQAYKVIPVDNEPFDIVINGHVEIDGDKITIDGKTATIL